MFGLRPSLILTAALWYEEREFGLGLEVINEVRAAINRALEHPSAYFRLRRHPEVRRALTRRFPYRVFYIVRSDAVVVFAVLHASRHDVHWQPRIESE